MGANKKPKRGRQNNHPVEPTVEEDVLGALSEFTEALDKNEVAQTMTCRQISLDLEPREYSPELIKKTRAILGLSQVLFARFLGVAANTVRSWEQGASSPSPIACRFMDEIRESPKYWRDRLVKKSVSRMKSVSK